MAKNYIYQLLKDICFIEAHHNPTPLSSDYTLIQTFLQKWQSMHHKRPLILVFHQLPSIPSAAIAE